MKKFLLLLSSLMLITALLFTGCQPPEVTSAKVYMNDNNYEMALEQAKTAVEKYPDNATAWFTLGKVHSELKNIKEMVDAYDKSLEISSKHADEINNTKEILWFSYFNQGIENYKNNKLEEAVQNFKNTITLKPDDMNAYKNLALCYSNLDDDEKTISTLKKALEIDPDNVDMQRTLGVAHYQAHEFEKAIDIFQQVAEKTESDTAQTEIYAEAIQRIAFSYDQLGQSEKAINAYKTALDIFPDNTDLIYNLGRLYYMQENYENAIENFKQIAEKNLDDYDAVYNTAMAYLRAGKNEEAIPYFKKAIEIKPDSYDAWNNLGIVYVRANMSQKGKEAFDKADELKTTSEQGQEQE